MDVDYSPELVTVVKFRKSKLNETNIFAAAESDGTVNLYDALAPDFGAQGQ